MAQFCSVMGKGLLTEPSPPRSGDLRRTIRENVRKHKAALLLDTESGSLATYRARPSWSGPGQDSRTGRRHGQNANSFHPFDSLLYFAVCGVVIITWAGRKGKGAENREWRTERGEGRGGRGASDAPGMGLGARGTRRSFALPRNALETLPVVYCAQAFKKP